MDGISMNTHTTTLVEVDPGVWRQETAAMMRAWQREKESLETTVTQANARITLLKRKIEHAVGLLEDESAQDQAPPPEQQQIEQFDVNTEQDEDAASHAAVIGGAIDVALSRAPVRGLTCATLRVEIQKNPAVQDRLKDHPNRFYSILNRRVGKHIIKKGKYYRLPLPDSPQGETGAVAAPASING